METNCKNLKFIKFYLIFLKNLTYCQFLFYVLHVCIFKYKFLIFILTLYSVCTLYSYSRNFTEFFSGCHTFAKTSILTLHHGSYSTMDTFHFTLQCFPFSHAGTHFLGDTGRFSESSHTWRYEKRSMVLSLWIYPSYSLLPVRESLYVPSLYIILVHEPAYICTKEWQWYNCHRYMTFIL